MMKGGRGRRQREGTKEERDKKLHGISKRKGTEGKDIMSSKKKDKGVSVGKGKMGREGNCINPVIEDTYMSSPKKEYTPDGSSTIGVTMNLIEYRRKVISLSFSLPHTLPLFLYPRFLFLPLSLSLFLSNPIYINMHQGRTQRQTYYLPPPLLPAYYVFLRAAEQ